MYKCRGLKLNRNKMKANYSPTLIQKLLKTKIYLYDTTLSKNMYKSKKSYVGQLLDKVPFLLRTLLHILHWYFFALMCSSSLLSFTNKFSFGPIFIFIVIFLLSSFSLFSSNLISDHICPTKNKDNSYS